MDPRWLLDVRPQRRLTDLRKCYVFLWFFDRLFCLPPPHLPQLSLLILRLRIWTAVSSAVGLWLRTVTSWCQNYHPGGCRESHSGQVVGNRIARTEST